MESIDRTGLLLKAVNSQAAFAPACADRGNHGLKWSQCSADGEGKVVESLANDKCKEIGGRLPTSAEFVNLIRPKILGVTIPWDGDFDTFQGMEKAFGESFVGV